MAISSNSGKFPPTRLATSLKALPQPPARPVAKNGCQTAGGGLAEEGQAAAAAARRWQNILSTLRRKARNGEIDKIVGRDAEIRQS